MSTCIIIVQYWRSRCLREIHPLFLFLRNESPLALFDDTLHTRREQEMRNLIACVPDFHSRSGVATTKNPEMYSQSTTATSVAIATTNPTPLTVQARSDQLNCCFRCYVTSAKTRDFRLIAIIIIAWSTTVCQQLPLPWNRGKCQRIAGATPLVRRLNYPVKCFLKARCLSYSL
jgi:hypothetical protein